MPHRPHARHGGAAPKALVLIVGAVGCLAAAAYAAVPGKPAGSPANPERRAGAAQLPRPAITQHPDKVETSANARFAFAVRGRNLRFQCRLDGRRWKACRPPVSFAGLAPGSHSFAVRSVGQGGGHGRLTRFRWQVLEPKDFSIVPQLAGLGALYPGAPAQALPLTIANPNPVPIFVTSLQVKATADPPGCTSTDNLLLFDSSASDAAPIKVPASGSLSLPAPGAAAPSIQLRDLPVNQDACQRTHFPLSFSGTARG